MPLIRIICSLLLLASIAEAETMRGLYGELGVRYEQYDRADKYADTERNTLLQDYSMGYASYLYNPLFLMYDLEATLHYEDTHVTSNGNDKNKKIRGVEYNLDLKFIQKTDYPFRIFALKRQRPYWDDSPGRNYYLDENVERAGINGLVRMALFNLGYTAEITDINRDGNEEVDNRKDIRYTLSLDKKMSDSYLNANYIHNNREVNRTILASNYSPQSYSYQTHETTNDVNLRYDWTISPTLKFNTWGRYFDNNNTNFVDTSGSAGLQWQPTKQYTASVDARVDRFKSDYGETKTMNLIAASYYRVGRSLTLDQSLSMMNSSGDFGSYSSNNVRVGGRYNKPFGDNYTFRANGYITLDNDTNAFTDLNETEYENNIVTYNVGSGISKYILSLKGTLSFDASYSNRQATASESIEVISANTYFKAKPLSNLEYLFRADYTKEFRDYANSVVLSQLNKIDAERYSADTGFKYTTSLTRKGRMSLEAGISHSSREDTTGASVQRTLPRGRLDLRYKPVRSVTYSAVGNVFQDMQAETTTYTARTDLVWNVRQTIVQLGASYLEQVGGYLGERKDTRLHAEIKRRF